MDDFCRALAAQGCLQHGENATGLSTAKAGPSSGSSTAVVSPQRSAEVGA
jgi:hypothetical protein